MRNTKSQGSTERKSNPKSIIAKVTPENQRIDRGKYTLSNWLEEFLEILNLIKTEVGFIKGRYLTPPKKSRAKLTKEERKAIIKHKLMTKNRKID